MTRVCRWHKSAELSLVLAVVASVTWGARAQAQEEAIPDSVATDVEASKTEAAGEATFAAPPDLKEPPSEEEAAPEEEAKAEINWSLSLGGAVNTGNTKSWNIYSGSDFKLLKESHTLTMGALFNFGRADVAPTNTATGYSTVSKQLFFNSRYDYFFTDMDAFWASLGIRWDPLAGFKMQLLASAGYLRAFIKTDKHYFAGRIGYSYTYENYEALPMVPTLTDNSNIHGLLAALDYENKLNEHVEFLANIVTIYNLNNVDVQGASPFEDIRIYLTAALLSRVNDKLAFEGRFLMLYDRLPAALVKTDTATIFSLVYTFM